MQSSKYNDIGRFQARMMGRRSGHISTRQPRDQGARATL